MVSFYLSFSKHYHYPGNMYSGFSGDSEAVVSEFLDSLEETKSSTAL